MVTLWPAATCNLRQVSRNSSSGPCQKVATSGSMRHLLTCSSQFNSRPGALGLRLGLISVDRCLLFHGEPDVVEAVHQAVLAERIDLELHLAAVRAADLLVGEVDGQRRIGAALGVVE